VIRAAFKEAPALGTSPAAAVRLGAAPPGVSSMEKAAQQWGINDRLAKKAAMGFGSSKCRRVGILMG
jgi:hypothetical protein